MVVTFVAQDIKKGKESKRVIESTGVSKTPMGGLKASKRRMVLGPMGRKKIQPTTVKPTRNFRTPKAKEEGNKSKR